MGAKLSIVLGLVTCLATTGGCDTREEIGSADERFVGTNVPIESFGARETSAAVAIHNGGYTSGGSDSLVVFYNADSNCGVGWSNSSNAPLYSVWNTTRRKCRTAILER